MRKTSLTVCLILGLAACGSAPKATVVTGVRLDRNELNLVPGQIVQLQATVEPADAKDKTITWKTDDKNVATVREGTVTAVEEAPPC